MRFKPNQKLWLKDSAKVGDPYYEVTYLHDSETFPTRIIVDTQNGVVAGVPADLYTDVKPIPGDKIPEPQTYKIDSEWVDANGKVWVLTTLTPNGNLIFESDDDIMTSKKFTLPDGFKPQYKYQDTYAALFYDSKSNTIFYNCFRTDEESTRKAASKDWKDYKLIGIVKLSAKEVEIDQLERQDITN